MRNRTQDKSLKELVADTLSGRVDFLSLQGEEITSGEDIRLMIRAVFEAPSLRSFALQDVVLNPESAALLTQALASRKDIESVSFLESPLTDSQVAGIADALRDKPHLHKISFRGILGDGGVCALADMIAASPQLREINLIQNDWSQASHDKLAQALENSRDLTLLTLQYNGVDLQHDAFETVLLGNPHPNFYMLHGIDSAPLKQMAENNETELAKSIHFFLKLGQQDQNYAALAENTSATEIFGAEIQHASLNNMMGRNGQGSSQYEFLIQHMPKLDLAAPLDVALFTPDSAHLTPLENPLVWEAHPGLLDRLAGQRLLTPELLQRRTEKGTSLLEAACAFRPTSEVLSTLNRLNMRMDERLFFAEDHIQTPLMGTIALKGEIPQLFTADNWAGRPLAAFDGFVQDVKRMYPHAAIPPLQRLRTVMTTPSHGLTR